MRNGTIARRGAALALFFAATTVLAGPQNARAAADELLGVATLSAVIQSNGNFARQVGVESAARLALGEYEVIFERDVQNCTYTANAQTGAGNPTFGLAMVASRAGNLKGVYVKMLNKQGTVVDGGFHLIVFCGY